MHVLKNNYAKIIQAIRYFVLLFFFAKWLYFVVWSSCRIKYTNFNTQKNLQVRYKTKLAFPCTDKILVWHLYKHMTVYSHRSTIHLVCKWSLCTGTHLKTKTKKVLFSIFMTDALKSQNIILYMFLEGLIWAFSLKLLKHGRILIFFQYETSPYHQYAH